MQISEAELNGDSCACIADAHFVSCFAREGDFGMHISPTHYLTVLPVFSCYSCWHSSGANSSRISPDSKSKVVSSSNKLCSSY